MGGDIDLSNPAKPTLKYLKNIRTVINDEDDIYFVFDLNNAIDAFAIHFYNADTIEYGYGTINDFIISDHYKNDKDLVDDLKLFEFRRPKNSGIPIVANGSYNGNSGVYVFHLATIAKMEIPVTIIFINSATNAMWYRSNTVRAIDESNWNGIKAKIEASLDFSSDIASFLNSYRKL